MNQYDSEAVMFDPQDAVLVLEDGQVYVGEPYGASVLPFSSGDISGEGDRVEQSAYDENSATFVFRKVFIEHQQIITVIQE